MRIGIDARSMSIEGGVKNYIINLVNCLTKIDKRNKYFIYYDSKKNFGTFKQKNVSEVVMVNKYRFTIPYWEQKILMERAIKDNLDLLHGPKNTIPINLPKNIKKISTINDMTPFLFPNEMSYLDTIYWKKFIPLSLKRCDKIIAISKSTERDVKEIIPMVGNKIKVIYDGVNEKKFYSSKRKKFILLVGTLRPRKNLKRVLDAYSTISKRNPDYKLLIVGKNLNQKKDLLEEISYLNLENKVELKGFLTDRELKKLYSQASLYIYPSLYEGFGLPILEAQASGCPVITSNISSMPEVAGNGALLVNPYNVDEIAEAMNKVLTDDKLRKNLIKEGYKNIKRFSWEKTAKETLKVYEEVLNEKIV